MGLPLTVEEKKDVLVDEIAALVQKKAAPSQAALIAAFVRQYYRRVGPEDLLGRNLADLYGAALAHWGLAHCRRRGERLLRVYNPRVEEHGWHSTHTIVEVVQEDMPFLVDSIRMELNRQGLTVHLTMHPVMAVQRDVSGELVGVAVEPTDAKGFQNEAMMHFEVDRQTDTEVLDCIGSGVERVLEDVRTAVEDWPHMRQRLQEATAALERHAPPADAEEITEACAFLRWLDRESFTFLGYREYTLKNGGLTSVADSGLGISREPRTARPSASLARLSPSAREQALGPHPLVLTKGDARATVHRPGYLDYVGVRRFDARGRVVGEARFLGRYSSAAYTSRPTEIPLVRRKVAQVMARSALRPGSHSAKALLNILETLPRDELIQGTAEELFDIATGILHLQERQQVKLLVRRDPFHRFLTCLVYLPRDRFNTEVRHRVQALLARAFDAASMDFALSISDSALARLYLTIYVEGPLPDYDTRDLEAHIVAATRSWSDELHDALLQELGEEQGNRHYAEYRQAFPASYCEDYSAAVAVRDIGIIERLTAAGEVDILLYRPLEAGPGRLRIKIFRREQPISLSTVLPMLENMGVSVSDERPHEIRPQRRRSVWVHDLGMSFEADRRFDAERIRQRFRDAFSRVWHGTLENDGFNRLVLHADCTWREANILRAYCRYLVQTEFPFSQRYVEQVLLQQPQITRMLVDLFRVRLDPDHRDRAAEREERLADGLLRSLEAVPNLDEDRILRRYYLLIRATLRSNYFQRGPHGQPKPYLSFKLDPTQLPGLPEPRPRFEVFVHSPRVEGVHLRGGKVARGGIRWSDRQEDYRTEIFGLMKAQIVKNAVIVPVGAKGGFIVKRAATEPAALRAEVVECYQTFIRGLLDLTDNLTSEGVRPPPATVRHDDDDPYLVVAADKGTATFSDLANAVAAEYSFWLGDAFASGGSTGYDHKKMGITARGAWESVKRHFRELGRDIQREDFTVVGIGSMNGDVFGNGMLLSRHIRLVGAFSHRAIFLDPDPDAERSYRERRRLFEQGASWEAYDPDRISAGGGVFPRSAKSIALSPQVRARLGIEAEALSPNDLIRALLTAPVDLLWNGGIGTFVKAGDEDDEAVGDRANDPVRVNARDLRCRVIGEGGNLGLTQHGRTEFARHGGRVNTDFIDNSGGVDCSDHEVNIKILLHGPVTDGRLPEPERNRLLAAMTDDVATLVLANNARQAEALSMAASHAAEFEEHVTFMRTLERRGYLERRTWALPDDDTVEARRAAREGLTRPELAVLLAYSKISLYDALLESGLGEDSSLLPELSEYFPQPIVEGYRQDMERHRLRPEIVAAFVANGLVNRLGITAAHRLTELSGRSASEVARAFLATRRLFDLPALWDAIAAETGLPAERQLDTLDGVRRLANRVMLWLLRNHPQPLDIEDVLSRYRPCVDTLSATLTDLLDPADHAHWSERLNAHRQSGVPESLATRLAALPFMAAALDICSVAAEQARPVARVARLYFALGSAMGVHWLRERIGALSTSDHWSRLAREGLRDELFRLHRQLTLQALAHTPASGDIGEAIAAWVEANHGAVEQYQERTEQFRAAEADLALLSVAMSELRRLAGSG